MANATLGNGLDVPKNVKHRLSYNPATRLLDRYPREMKTCVHSNTWARVFTATLLMTQNWKQPKCPPTDEWINKIW